MVKYNLVIDVAGVLLSNLSPGFWDELAQTAGVSYERLKSKFKQEVRDSLWCGKIKEEDFWEWISIR
ncbi:hypothetical protein [Cohnella herbarum]|uniref:Uncharacterized protein n=1 Tax=Cohnella herbarum TaxID=2728023 RepID=A0A7Z2VGB7_9BACL|nr:hypothetical protein [Cohnella herbarum]QJD82663.1 hypothetical protein HH215_05320 [Cohnella herbarum]